MNSLHVIEVVVAAVFAIAARYLGKKIVSLIQTIENFEIEMVPYRIKAHLAFEDLCARRPEMRGILDAMVTESDRRRKNDGKDLEGSYGK
jgi:hypothetical protein